MSLIVNALEKDPKGRWEKHVKESSLAFKNV
jgi:hypothetical protein